MRPPALVHSQLPATDGQARRAQGGPAEAPKELVQEVPARSSSHLLIWARCWGPGQPTRLPRAQADCPDLGTLTSLPGHHALNMAPQNLSPGSTPAAPPSATFTLRGHPGWGRSPAPVSTSGTHPAQLEGPVHSGKQPSGCLPSATVDGPEGRFGSQDSWMHTQPQWPGTVLPARVREQGARRATFKGSSSKPHPSPSSQCQAVTDRDRTESTPQGPEITAEATKLTEDKQE